MQKIHDLRLKIDEVDQKLLDLIKERLELVKEIGQLKKESGIKVVDRAREEEILDRLEVLAKKKSIELEIIKRIWKILIEISYEIEGEKNGNS